MSQPTGANATPSGPYFSTHFGHTHFNQWGEVVLSNAHSASSHQRRFERWFHNHHIKPIRFFFPLLRAAMQLWPPEQLLYLAIDASDLKNGYLLIRLVLIYRGRAIPLTWRVIKHNRTSVSYRVARPG